MGISDLKKEEMIYKDKLINLSIEYDVEFSTVLDFGRFYNFDMKALEYDVGIISANKQGQRRIFRSENPCLFQ